MPASRTDPDPVPAEGGWLLAGAAGDPRRAAPRLRGRLEVRAGLLGSRLRVTTETAVRRGAPVPVDIDARLVRADRRGGWRFEGTATVGGARVPVAVAACYHGLFRSGERATGWWRLSALVPAPGGGRRLRARPRALFAADVNAERVADPVC